MLLSLFVRKNEIASNCPKSLITVHKCNNNCKKYDFAISSVVFQCEQFSELQVLLAIYFSFNTLPKL